jgi:SAM-dependent methyltransferase
MDDSSLDEMIPDDATAAYVGGGDKELFKMVGRQLMGWFIELGGLEPTDRVLEVGCGIGRIAIPLTQYLKGGSYDGFDIVKHGIEWCQAKITPRYPNFRFVHADSYNQHYNPLGKQKAAEYRFPYANGSFDFVFLTSVFTHMLTADVENYVREIGRVLVPGGRCFFTAYLISEEARAQMTAGTSLRIFQPCERESWTDTPAVPEAAIAYPEKYLETLLASAGLQVTRALPGEWWKNPTAQDIVVAVKAEANG